MDGVHCLFCVEQILKLIHLAAVYNNNSMDCKRHDESHNKHQDALDCTIHIYTIVFFHVCI